MDVPSIGSKYTWFKVDGSVMIRLGKFLLFEGLVKKWKVNGQLVGKRDISDHFPIWIYSNNLNWDPKPFKIFNGWFEHQNFIPFIEEVWKSTKVQGNVAYMLKYKFIILKDKLRNWNSEV